MKYTALLVLLTFPLLCAAPARAVTFDWATVGNPGNDYDIHGDGYGGVDYTYRISKHEVTNEGYTEFLNAVDPTGANAVKLYNFEMKTTSGGIAKLGTVDGARYIAQAGREQNPVTFVSFFDAMRFVNWLHNGQGSGDTESGAYTIGNGTDEERSTDAKFWIPSEDEWYKAAYYDPTSSVYYDYPTGTDTDPYSDNPARLNTPDDTNVANFAWNDGIANGYHDGWAVTGSTSFDRNQNYLNDVGAYSLAVSPYGTFDQGGNVTEWTEGFTSSFSGRILRGGSWNFGLPSLRADKRFNDLPTGEVHFEGFRVATVPEVVGDCNGDSLFNAADLSCVSSVEARDVVLDALNTLPGDVDGNGEVAFADFLVLSANFGTDLPSYAEGNIDLNNGVDFEDFLVLSTNFGKTAADVAAVPEPAGFTAVWLSLIVVTAVRHSHKLSPRPLAVEQKRFDRSVGDFICIGSPSRESPLGKGEKTMHDWRSLMKVLATAIPLLTLMCVCTHATADAFGTGANRFAIEFVEIGDPGNPPDTTGCDDEFSSCGAPKPNPSGSVDYIYRIGKFEVSRDMVEEANVAGGLGIAFSTRSWSRPEAPATGVSWNEAARFVNWLNTSQGFPAAYKFTVQPGDIDYDALLRAPFGLASGNIELWAEGDAGFDAANFFRNSQARYFLPSVHEWYKAGYYDPATGGYWDYPTGSNTPPVAVAGGTDPNTAVYGHEFEQGPADITQAGGLSPYGVMGLGGNAGEWEETTVDLRNDDGSRFSSRGMRESAWNTSQISFWPRRRNSAPPDFGSSLLGLRVASAFVERGLLGDFNGDDVVDTVDFQIMADNFNSEGEFSNGDINFNGFVDMADFLEFRAIFAQTPQAASVPEPAFGFISLLASCVLFCVARRHRSL